MTTPITSLIGQSLPEKSLNQLSLVGHSKAEMQGWVDSLPIMNVGETAKRLYQTLQELTRLKTTEENRYELLEVLRPSVQLILQALAKHYLNQSILLPDRANRVASLAQALRSYLATGYKIVAFDCVEKLQTKLSIIGIGRRQQQQLAAQSFQRAISELGGLLLEIHLLYLPSPVGLWLDLHTLYRAAVAYGVAQTKIPDVHAPFSQSLTVTESYLRCLILAASHTNKLRQTEIKQIYDASELWTNHLKIKTKFSVSDLLLIDTDNDFPPSYVSKSVDVPHPLYIDAQKLVQHLQTIQSTPPAQLTKGEVLASSLYQHLITIWSAPTERTFARRSYEGQLFLCLGLTATHYHLADELDFESVINIRQTFTEEEANLFLRNGLSEEGGQPDIWHFSLSSVDSIESEIVANNRKKQGTPDLYPPTAVSIVNISPGGYCIRWQGEPPISLRTGEILALREPDDSSWNIGVIRWVKQLPTEGAEAGIEILSARAKPCGARVIKKTGDSTEYMRTLLLPEMKSLHRPATLITPNVSFRSGYRVLIRLGNEEVKVQLTTEMLTTQSFSQFEFALLQSQDKPQSIVAGKPTATALKADNKDDFDSLWINL
ncbi:hypothetical protein [Agitococcus lubricus]|uniref:GTPase n=1 Tax=Agitococcus lubricus TaxID=1077255 RepID=A0A2T5IUX5_9GAMM|nr:hypothetical protein [Agitococcus lubricus]PTQ87701.1 hypothetical protein C8N29_11725 [Agitococcus lubricus]